MSADRNAAGNMTLPVEVHDVSACLDILDAMYPMPGEPLYYICVRLAALLETPWPVEPKPSRMVNVHVTKDDGSEVIYHVARDFPHEGEA